MKRKLWLAWVGMALPMLSIAQTLQINQPFPLKELPVIMQDTISKYRGKFIILDNFSSGCSVCFSAMPKLKALQHFFDPQLQFIMLGKQDDRIEKIYGKIAANYQLSFPVIYDSFFYQRTGSGYFPTYIWVDSAGITRAITDASGVTEEHIHRFLRGGSIQVQLESLTFDRSRPYLLNGNGGSDSIFLLRSLLTEWKEGQPVYLPSRIFPSADTVQLLGVRFDQLYRYASTGTFYWSETDSLYERVYSMPMIDSADSLVTPINLHRYSYSLISRSTDKSKDVLKILLDDLNRSMPYDAVLEERWMPYWRLSLRSHDTSLLASKHNRYEGIRNHVGLDVKAYPIKNLIHYLHTYHPFGPIFRNETGIEGKIDIKVDAVFQDIESLRKGLWEAGICMERSQIKMKVVVLRKKETDIASQNKGQ